MSALMLQGAILAADAPHAVVLPAPPQGAGPRDTSVNSITQLADQFEKAPATVVADVNGTSITAGMVADRLRDMSLVLAALPTSTLYRNALDDLVTQRALAVKARELGLDKDPATIRRIAEATDHELGRALMRKVVPEMVTEQAIENQYKQSFAGKPGPDEVEFRVIATATDSDADDVISRLEKGAKFEDLARQISKDASAFAGGTISYTRRDRLAPEIGAVVFALSPGQRTAYPVFSNGLWFIIEVLARRQTPALSLTEARSRVTNQLDHDASLEIFSKIRASVTVHDFGPTGARGQDAGTPSKSP